MLHSTVSIAELYQEGACCDATGTTLFSLVVSRHEYMSSNACPFIWQPPTTPMNANPLVDIRDANLPHDIEVIRHLWTEYLTWGNDRMQSLYGVHPHNPEETAAHDITVIDIFQPPKGRLKLAHIDANACGIGCLKRIDDEIGEIKRMYVDPSFRQIGAGRALLRSLLDAAKEAGYKKVRLDSPKFMEAAHSLYRRFGFKDISAYEGVEIPEEFRQHLLFMELDLSSPTHEAVEYRMHEQTSTHRDRLTTNIGEIY